MCASHRRATECELVRAWRNRPQVHRHLKRCDKILDLAWRAADVCGRSVEIEKLHIVGTRVRPGGSQDRHIQIALPQRHRLGMSRVITDREGPLYLAPVVGAPGGRTSSSPA